MSVYVLKTQILSPEEEKSISFSGSNPARFFKIIPGLIKHIFKVTSSHFFEDRIKWDVGETSVQFYGMWRGEEGKDRRSRVWAQVKLQGVQNLDKEKIGEGVILLTGFVETSFPYLTILDKTLYKTYTYLYYNNQIRYYLEEARRRFQTLETELKREIGLIA